jgi:hypothetical protein
MILPSFIARHRHSLIFLLIIIAAVLTKLVWVDAECSNIGTFEKEKADILKRKNWLVHKIIVKPRKLISEMPSAIGEQFQGEWALYSCSMLAEAIANIAVLYPETKDEATIQIDSLISIAMSPEIRRYDSERWSEDPLETLDGDKSHISYLSHLAWMIGNYKRTGGGSRYDDTYHAVCRTMNRRISRSKTLNLRTYPSEDIYLPDMMVAIVALSQYSARYHGRYADTVKRWIARAKSEWVDPSTGLLASFMNEWGEINPVVKGSYSALNCFYLTKVDTCFAARQYDALKETFRQTSPVNGLREYATGLHLLELDLDAGPILLNLSPTGTAFAIGSATFFADSIFRSQLLHTGELAGTTVGFGSRRHYLLANMAVVGEAITLAMRTNKNHTSSSISISSLAVIL